MIDKFQILRDRMLHIRDSAEAAGRDFTDTEVALLDAGLELAEAARPSNRVIDPQTTSGNGFGRTRGLDLSSKPRLSQLFSRGEGDRTNGFKSFGEFASTVIHRPHDDRLTIRNTGSEGSGPGGGFSVPPEWADALLDSFVTSDDLLSRLRVVPMQSNTLTTWGLKDASHSSQAPYGFTTLWLSENTQATGHDVTLRSGTLTAHKMMVLSYFSGELADDSPSFERELADAMATAVRWELARTVVRGTGAGQPQGLVNAPCAVSVAKEGSQTADTIVLANVVKMWQTLLPGSHSRAIWIINPNATQQILQLSYDGSGAAPAYMPMGGLSSNPFETLLGRPIVWSEHASTLGDQGDIILFDPQAYLLGIRSDVRMERDPYSKFDYDQVGVRTILRADGQSALDQSFTDRAGNSYSTIVLLDERGT